MPNDARRDRNAHAAFMTEAGATAEKPLANALIQALVLYSVAEFQCGHCRSIRVDAADRRFLVEDDGRGRAIGRSVAGIPYLRLVYTHLQHQVGPEGLARCNCRGSACR